MRDHGKGVWRARARRAVLPLLAAAALLATSGCYYGPYGYYGYGYYPGYGYAYAPPVTGGVVVGAYPYHRYYWR